MLKAKSAPKKSVSVFEAFYRESQAKSGIDLLEMNRSKQPSWIFRDNGEREHSNEQYDRDQSC